MKKQFKFFSVLFAAAAMMASCSNDEPLNPVNPDEDDAAYGDSYISVSIDMSNSLGSRAAIDKQPSYEDDKFVDGTANESKVDNIVFFFFDGADHCIDIQKIDNPKFSKPEELGANPYVENIGTVEIRLKSNLNYSQVAVVLNSNSKDANTLQSQITNLDDLLSRQMDYASYITKTGSNVGAKQTMSNSVYFNESGAEMPTEKNILVKITENNIYTSDQRGNVDNIEVAEKERKYSVQIYVERVAARVDVETGNISVGTYSIEEGKNDATLTIFDHATLTEKEIVVVPVIKGLCLNVLTPSANLIKNIDANIGYKPLKEGDPKFNAFQWNDYKNRRSYWATTNFNSEADIVYLSYDDAKSRDENNVVQSFTQYINPNTQDFAPVQKTNNVLVSVNEGNSMNTKVMMIAELRYKFKDSGEDKGPLDLIRYGADYMLSEDFYRYVASIIDTDVRNIDWANELSSLTEEQVKAVNLAVNNAFLGIQTDEVSKKEIFIGVKPDMFEIDESRRPVDEDPNDMKPIDSEWLAKIFTNANYTTFKGDNYGIELEDDLLASVVEVVEKTITSAIDKVNDTTILYWKDGKTYFYTNIRHQGFVGLAGTSTEENASDFLYGVVRNHIYSIDINGFYGLGTPVIDSGRPIDPDRPKDEKPSYIKAKINVLKWRVVKQNATLH